MKNIRVIGCETTKVDIDPADTAAAKIGVDSLTPAVFIATPDAVTIFGMNTQKSTVPLKGVVGGESDSVEILEYLSDQLLLFIGMAGGAIATLDPGSQAVECVGFVEGGIAGGSWSPDLEVSALISGKGVLYLINREMDVVGEVDEDPSTSGLEVPETVGWGKKETQFHGSLGKQAALSQTQEEEGLLDWDNRRAIVSWHGEGQYFAVSSVSKANVRKIRVWSREGVHLNTMEPTAGIEPTLSWRPDGNLIACSAQRKDGVEVMFFERNGLRHGGFPLRMNKDVQTIKSLSWNGTSSILAVHRSSISETTDSAVELWTSSNYHWSLKYTFRPKGGVGSFVWDPEDVNQIHFLLLDGTHQALRLHSLPLPPPPSTSAFLPVIDGKEIRVTDFEKAVIPPPMASYSISRDSVVHEAFFHPDGRQLFFTEAGKISQWDLLTRSDQECLNTGSNSNEFLWSWATNGKGVFCALASSHSKQALVYFSSREMGSKPMTPKYIELASRPILIVPNGDHDLLVQYSYGSWGRFDWEGREIEENGTKFRVNCSNCALAWFGSDRGPLIGLSERNQLFIESREVGTNVASFVLHSHFLLLTTLSHQLVLIPFKDLLNPDLRISAYESRSLERGSELVAAVPGKSRVVLQMPRGNLETINPRALSLHYLHDLLEKAHYKEAMKLMKKQRINLNLLVDHCPKTFLENLSQIISQVSDIPAMNMLLLELKDEDVRETMYHGLYPDCWKKGCGCQGNRKNLEKTKKILIRVQESVGNEKNCLTLALTAFVRSSPPQIEDALILLKKHMDSSENPTMVADEGLRHLLYLVNGEELFRMALATYDFDLILLVAERSQKDPKEYIPFLNDLRKLDSNYMKFKIDTILERYSKALGHIQHCGDERFDELVEFVKQHGLYLDSMKLFSRSSDQYSILCGAYAENLVKLGRHSEATLFFRWSGNLELALESGIRGSLWQEALEIVRNSAKSESERTVLMERVVDGLKERREYISAAFILEHELKNIEGAATCLCSGEAWLDALRVCQSNPSSKIGLTVVAPQMKKKVEELTSQLHNIAADLEKHTSRLCEVRQEKKVKWDAILAGDPDFAEADMYSETTMSTASQSSGRSNVSRGGTSRRGPRRVDRKKRTLKEGSRYEDFGLLNAIKDAMTKVNAMYEGIRDLLWASIRMELIPEAAGLREIYAQVLRSCENKLETVWPIQWLPHVFPGPPDETFRNPTGEDSDVAPFIPSLNSETAIKLDPALQRPQIPKSSDFKLEFVSFLQ